MQVIERDSRGNPTISIDDGFFHKNIKFYMEWKYPEDNETGNIDVNVYRMEFADGSVTEYPRKWQSTSDMLVALSNVASQMDEKPLPDDCGKILDDHLWEIV